MNKSFRPKWLRFPLILILIAASFISARTQESVEGFWEGTMVREGAVLSVSFDIKEDPAGIHASFNSPMQRAIGIPLQKVGFAFHRLHFELVGDSTTIVFDGVLSGDKISGKFSEGAAEGVFTLERGSQPTPTFREKEVSFKNKDVTLSGTLLLPTSNGPHPAVVFLHGSGSEGRYAGRFLAEYLTRYGIAALIYDKRGVGKSTGDWKQSNFNDLADDAIAGISFLEQRDDINPAEIGIYGHSQGGMIAPLVASKSKSVAFIISGAGSAVPVYESEINSLVSQLRAKGIQNKDLEEARAFVKIFIEVLRSGENRRQFEAAATKAQNKKWYPMLHVPEKDDWQWAFFRSIYNYNAADYWAKVSVPTLVIYGERDLYVPVSQSVAAIDRALNQAGNKDYTILVLPRASHAFNLEREIGDSFEWPRLTPGFPDLLIAWINLRTRVGPGTKN